MEKDNVVQLYPKKSEPDPQQVLAAMMEYESAYERYATAVQRYLKLTGQMSLIRHFLPLEESDTEE
tara:strand:- start:217 stop:414 length:198 start_codon:yes stop_codon:yes gene_type:complete